MLYVAVRAARKAGDIIIRGFDRREDLNIREKSDRDFVTNIDAKAEESIIKEILQHYPDHGIIAEESGILRPDAPIQWHIDPLDGTTNFIHGYPHFAVSIAAWRYGQPLLAVIHDPVRNETFEAKRGQGAFLNRRRLRVSNCPKISQAVFASGTPSYQREHIETFQKRMDSCVMAADSYRRGGSAALDLAYVASGRIDTYWEAGLKSWDIAAGMILVQEAGGIVSDLTGDQVDLKQCDILASNRAMHQAWIQLLDV